jgi:putative chitinase
MKFYRKAFFDFYRKEFGPLKESQVAGLDFIFDSLESDTLLTTDIRHVAYALATVKHETAHTFLPIAEYGKGRGYKYGKPDPISGKVYYGRGYVQLTWKRNYEVFSKLLGIDLVNDPDLAMQPATAFKIMALGMNKGLYTTKKLSDYIHDGVCNYLGARKIINGTDKDSLIAGHAIKFERCLRASLEAV